MLEGYDFTADAAFAVPIARAICGVRLPGVAALIRARGD
jgi:hypothetical protein